jgi:hypothetical protein
MALRIGEGNRIYYSMRTRTLQEARTAMMTHVLLFAGVLAATACGSTGVSGVGHPPLFTVTVTPDPATATLGTRLQLTATISNSTVTGPIKITWQSSYLTYATVDSTGLVTPNIQGTFVNICATGSSAGFEQSTGCARVNIVAP